MQLAWEYRFCNLGMKNIYWEYHLVQRILYRYAQKHRTVKHTDRDTHSQRDTQTDTHTLTDTHRHTQTQTDMQTDTHTDIHTQFITTKSWKIYIQFLFVMAMYECKVICPKAGLSLVVHYQGSAYLRLLDKRKE